MAESTTWEIQDHERSEVAEWISKASGPITIGMRSVLKGDSGLVLMLSYERDGNTHKLTIEESQPDQSDDPLIKAGENQ